MPRAFLITNRRYKTTKDYNSKRIDEFSNKRRPVSVFRAFCDGLHHLSSLEQLAEISLATATHHRWKLNADTENNFFRNQSEIFLSNSNDALSCKDECYEHSQCSSDDDDGDDGGDVQEDEAADEDDDDEEEEEDEEEDEEGQNDQRLEDDEMLREDVDDDLSLVPCIWTTTSSESGDTHICRECGKRYSTSSNLARHKQTHRSISDKKARKCPHCEKVYVSMPAYSMHVRTHGQGCQCPFCGKCFSRPWLLQGHIRTHTGEKPFKCSVCGKAFADKSNLRAHIQTHSNIKPYVCQRCGKAFALKSYLYKHEESSCMRSIGRIQEQEN